jgi:short subunit dehydrogenase-like uncharacterized protein
MTWMIYGATGYTGVLMAVEAAQRGHRPILAGRSEAKLKPMAQRLGLDYVAFGVRSKAEALAGLRRVDGLELVLHCAGPFTITGDPMLQACLEAGVHYLDITGEVKVFENTFAHHQQAVERGIVAMSGVGFDIVPSDCLVKYVADQVPDATELTVVIDALRSTKGPSMSAGTLKSGLEMTADGHYVRRNGKLIRVRAVRDIRVFHMPHGNRMAGIFNWGDVCTAYRTTGIPNITTYLAYPPGYLQLVRYYGWIVTLLLRITPLRRLIGWVIDRSIDGPSKAARETSRTVIYVQASSPDGRSAEAWMQCAEGYKFTALCGVRCVERVLDGDYSGALTPAAAFGEDFALEIPGTTRLDTLNRPG